MRHQFLLSLLMLGASTVCNAQNPIIKEHFTPDPAPYVHGDKVYMFADHDMDKPNDYFHMKEWLLYESKDMVNWKPLGNDGVIFDLTIFKWAKQGDDAWAGQLIERNGKWYAYVTATDQARRIQGIGVAVADKPEGPYVDPLGKPLVPGSWGYIDPTVFLDDDGQAYLFWGNNALWYAKLNEDMISLGSEITEVNTKDEDAFGPRKRKYDWQVRDTIWKTNYEEGPWVYKRKGLYYIVYAAGGVPEHMAYSTATSINGPWKYGGRILNEAENSFTIHGGIINFKGHDFIFYHNGKLPGGGGFNRSACIEEFEYNEDGSIPLIKFSEGITKPIKKKKK